MKQQIGNCLRLLLHQPNRNQLTSIRFKSESRHCLLTCKNAKLNHYLGTHYGNLDTVPLATKGWCHHKAVGDYFIVNPIPGNVEEGMIPLKLIGCPSDLTQTLQRYGIQKATSFQAQAIPVIQSRSHTLLAAETGCGKTLCYLLPIIQNIAGRKSKELNAPKAVVIVPNRELAYQVGEMAQVLSEPLDVKVKTVVGGRTKKQMMNPEFGDLDILVATPGALSKLSTVGVYKLHDVEHTVLDEADTLLDDSFIDRLEILLWRVPQSQIVLVSATIPKKLPEILHPIEATLKEVISPKVHKPLLHISQKFLRVSKSMKPSQILQLTKNNKHPMLIFTNKNETCNWLAMFLRENGVDCANINGDMNYAIRIAQWNSFVKGEVKVLSSTDVGSRGLDTTQVRHVVNYDFPFHAADYLHRIGRTGRLGSHESSKCTNFVGGALEVALVQQIELAIRRNQALTNVDGNITKIVQRKILRSQNVA